MSQKAWMNAFTKGSKELQDRLKKVHKNNPEFQSFLKNQGMDNTLSVKQSGLHKKSVATVKPVTNPHPERSNLDRLAVIKAAAERQRDRRHAASNRSSFGGELGGGFSMPGSGFRRYSEALEESKVEDAIRAHPGVSYYGGKSDDHFVELHKGYEMDGQRSFGNPSAAEAKKMLKHIKKVQATDEDVAYKDGHIAMYKGGWIAKRNGKRLGTTMPTDDDAKELLDSTRKSIGQKTMDVLKRKKAEIMRGLGHNAMAVENAESRKGGRSWDSAVTKRTLKDRIVKALERKRINKTVDYIKNPKYSVLNKDTINKLLKGE